MVQEVSSPKVAKTFGIIHLIVAGLFLLLSLWGIYQLFIASPEAQDNPVAEEMMAIQHELMQIPSVKWYFILANVVGFAELILLAVAGFMLLQRNPLGRTLSLVYAWAAIVTGILSVVCHMLFVQGPYTELLMASNLDENVQNAMSISTKIQPVAMFCCVLLYPVIILIFMLPEKFARSLGMAPVAAPLAEGPAEPPAAPQE